MPSVRSYLHDPWTEQPLFAESVPHLLHWDLAYLWVLSLEPNYQPASWRPRVRAWEKLLRLFLAGRLKIQPEEIQRPLRDFTSQYGITRIERLFLDQQAGEPLGVLSPVVIVRPLPDLDEEAMEAIPPVNGLDANCVDFCLKLLIDRLRSLVPRGGGAELVERNLQVELCKVLERYHRQPREGCPTVEVALRLLRTIAFTRGESEQATDEVTVFLLKRDIPQERVYVPRCEACHTLLTAVDHPDAAVPVTGETVELDCSNGHTNRIPLERLFLWRRSRPGALPEYIHWEDRQGSFPAYVNAQAIEWPPRPDLAEGDLRFRWNPGFLGGETKRLCLRLTFPHATLRRVSVRKEALYETLLVPGGQPSEHLGLPVRWEWRDAWQGAQADRGPAVVGYRAIQWRGLPFHFSLRYTNLSLEPSPGLAVGIYPKPMHPAWLPYRVAALGPAEPGVRIRVENGRGSIGSAQDVIGWPGWIAVESADGKTGSTWDVRSLAPNSRGSQPVVQARLRLGVDFGTSNTVTYFTAQTGATITTDENAVRLTDYRTQMHWLHPLADDFDTGWIFPRRVDPAQDPYLVPTALWMFDGDEGYIRWGAAPPQPSRVTYGFKWDDNLENRSGLRRRFLEELLFFSLPAIFDRLGNRTSRPSLDLGLAYPLAFSYEQRNDFRKLIASVADWCRDQAGLDTTAFSVNESLAAVRAYGTPDVDDLFLVADMGGRTLDVALFSYRSPLSHAEMRREDHYQIGSLDFGGELFLKKIAGVKSGQASGARNEASYWDLRDAIHQGAGPRRYQGDATIQETLDRFQIMALEYVRTMLRAFVEQSDGGRPRPSVERPVHLLLIGNGWRLRDLRSAGQSPEAYFEDYSARIVRAFEMAEVVVRPAVIAGIRSGKHWVALGALKCAMVHQAHELASTEPYPVRLPAGRRLTLGGKQLEWPTLVGSGGYELSNEREAKSGAIRCDIQSGPDTPVGWRQQLDQAIPEPRRYPTPDALRELLIASLDYSRLLRGPLQIILERHWKEQL